MYIYTNSVSFTLRSLQCFSNAYSIYYTLANVTVISCQLQHSP